MPPHVKGLPLHELVQADARAGRDRTSSTAFIRFVRPILSESRPRHQVELSRRRFSVVKLTDLESISPFFPGPRCDAETLAFLWPRFFALRCVTIGPSRTHASPPSSVRSDESVFRPRTSEPVTHGFCDSFMPIQPLLRYSGAISPWFLDVVTDWNSTPVAEALCRWLELSPLVVRCFPTFGNFHPP